MTLQNLSAIWKLQKIVTGILLNFTERKSHWTLWDLLSSNCTLKNDQQDWHIVHRKRSTSTLAIHKHSVTEDTVTVRICCDHMSRKQDILGDWGLRRGKESGEGGSGRAGLAHKGAGINKTDTCHILIQSNDVGQHRHVSAIELIHVQVSPLMLLGG